MSVEIFRNFKEKIWRPSINDVSNSSGFLTPPLLRRQFYSTIRRQFWLIFDPSHCWRRLWMMFFVNSFYVFWIHLGTRNWFGHHIRSQFEHLSQDIFFHCTAVQQWYDILLNRLSLKRLNLTYFFIDFVDQSYDSVKEKQLDVISFSFLTWVSFARFDIMKKIISILARTSSFLSVVRLYNRK